MLLIIIRRITITLIAFSFIFENNHSNICNAQIIPVDEPTPPLPPFTDLSSPSSVFHHHHRNHQQLFRNQRSSDYLNDNESIMIRPPRIHPDLDLKFYFYDSLGANLRCTAEASPRANISWHSIDLIDSLNDNLLNYTTNDDEGTLSFGKSQTTMSTSIFFCTARNIFGLARSRKMVVFKVPKVELSSIKYESREVKPGYKAIISCRPSHEDLSRFYRLKNWEIYLNNKPYEIVKATHGRYSVINIFPNEQQLHINNVSKMELMQQISVACILESIVEPTHILKDPSSIAILKENTIDSVHAKMISNDIKIDVDYGTRVELPCPLLGGRTEEILWRFNDHLIDEQAFHIFNGNLVINKVDRNHTGRYKCTHPLASDSTAFSLRVKIPLSVEIVNTKVFTAYGSRVELTCKIIGNPISKNYWLINGRLVNETLDYRIVKDHKNDQTVIVERLVIDNFDLSHVGVYQCVAESYEQISLDNKNEKLIDNAIATKHLLIKEMAPKLVSQEPKVEGDHGVASFNWRSHTEKLSFYCLFASQPLGDVVWSLDDYELPKEIQSKYSIQINRAITKVPNTPYLYNASLEINLDMLFDESQLWRFGGEYRARMTNDLGNATCRIFTTVNADLRIRRIPSNQALLELSSSSFLGNEQTPLDMSNNNETAILNRHFTMKCYAIGLKTPTLKWRRNYENDKSKYIPMDHRHELIEGGRVFVINSVQMSDEGQYECIAKQGTNQETIIKNLIVKKAPVIQALTPSLNVSFRNEINLFSVCNAMSADKPWYAWWEFQKYKTRGLIRIDPDSNPSTLDLKIEYADTDSDENFVLPSGLNSLLPEFVKTRPNSVAQIRNIGPLIKNKHHGNLICVIRNSVGEARSSIAISFMPELEFDARPPNSIDVILKQNIFIDCSPKKSEFDVYVEWKYSNQKYSLDQLSQDQKERIRQHENGTLSIIGVEEDDPKKFYCFLKHPNDANIQNSSALNLEIHVPARIQNMPREEKKVRGSKFNLTCSVYGDEKNRIVDWYFRPINSSIWIHLKEPTCVLTDKVYESCRTYRSDPENEIQYLVHTKYDENDKLRVEKLLEFINVKTNYMGEYKCVTVNEYNSDENNGNYDLEGLQVDSRSIEATMKLIIIGIPGKALFSNNQRATTSNSIYLDWSQPKDTGNLPLTFYQLQVDSNPTESQRKITVPANQTYYEINNLRPYTSYTIRIEAANSVGKGPSDSVTLVTQESKPSAAVRSLNCSSASSDEIEVKWDDPEMSHQNGNIDRYWICKLNLNLIQDIQSEKELSKIDWPKEYSEGDLNISSQFNCETVHIARYIELQNLAKFTSYGIRVVALNSKGSSPPAYCYARTLEDLPQEEPLHVKCTGLQHSISVSWDTPNLTSINGILTGYKVHYFKTNSFKDESNILETKVDPRTSQMLKGLTPFTNYTIRVYAVNTKGQGPPSKDKYCMTSEAPPNAPEKIKILLKNETCVNVIWTHPSQPNGVIKYYCLSQQQVDQENRNRPITALQYSTCLPSDFTNDYQSKEICNFEMKKFYRITIRGKHTFEGKTANSDIFTPQPNSNLSIISIGNNMKALPGSDLLLRCEISQPIMPKWTFTNDQKSIVEIMPTFENGSYLIKQISKSEEGIYNCSISYDQQISYKITVVNIDESYPSPPTWRNAVTTTKSIQVEWNAPAQWPSAPITAYLVNWTNHYTGEMNHVKLSSDQRTYFIGNLTCATKLSFNIIAENKYGIGGMSNASYDVSTSGQTPMMNKNTNIIVIPGNKTNSILFDMSPFIKGRECPPFYYQILISTYPIVGMLRSRRQTSDRKANREERITKDELISIDPYRVKEKWFINVTNLNAASNYFYSIRAENPAGSLLVNGKFQSAFYNNRNFDGSLESLHNLNEANLMRPSILIPLSIMFILLLVLALSLVFYYKHRKLADNLFNSNNMTTSTTYNGKIIMAIDPVTGLPISNMTTANGKRRYMNNNDLLMSKEKLLMQRYKRQTKRHFLSSLIPGPLRKMKSKTNFDTQSVKSMDSQGQINPYATYEATGPLTGSNSKPSTALLSGNIKTGSDATCVKLTPDEAFRQMLKNQKNQNQSTLSNNFNHSQMNKKSNWLESVPSSSLSRRRLINNLKNPQAMTYVEHMENQRNLMMLASTNAKAIIDPINAAYDIGADGMISNASIYSGRSNSGRRFNSMESLNRLGPTYHRGFPGSILNDYSDKFVNNANILYDSNQSMMLKQNLQRSQLHNSTGFSSNNEELLQAYEFGQRASNNEKMLRMKQIMSQARTGGGPLISSHLNGNDKSGMNYSSNGLSIDYQHQHPVFIKSQINRYPQTRGEQRNIIMLRQTSQPKGQSQHQRYIQQQVSCDDVLYNGGGGDMTYASIDYNGNGTVHRQNKNTLVVHHNSVPKRPLPDLPINDNHGTDQVKKTEEEIQEITEENLDEDDENVYTKEFVVV